MKQEYAFMACCKSLADIDRCIEILNSIGLSPDPSNNNEPMNFSGYLYDSCTGMIDVAMSYLDLENESMKTQEDIYSALLNANPDTYLGVAMEVWKKYGRHE